MKNPSPLPPPCRAPAPRVASCPRLALGPTAGDMAAGTAAFTLVLLGAEAGALAGGMRRSSAAFADRGRPVFVLGR